MAPRNTQLITENFDEQRWRERCEAEREWLDSLAETRQAVQNEDAEAS